jgi:uncharacterized protein Yka (UPF0111/DUF47 family)
MLKGLLPKGAPFFEYLLQQNKVMCSISALIPRLVEKSGPARAVLPARDGIQQEADVLEREGDALYLQLIRDLSQTFITPIDREDILRIGKELEAMCDLLENLVARLHVFNLPFYPLQMKRIAKNINGMVLLTRSMLEGLAQKRDSHDTRAFRVLQDECEVLLSAGLGEALDVQEMTPQTVMGALKLTRAYDRMEQAVHQVAELAEAIEEAVLKNV